MVQITAQADSARSLERQREILRAASELFRGRGVAATGMREIAASAGMTAGNLYYYFESKQALLAFCQRDAVEGLLDMAEAIEAERGPVIPRLRRLVRGHLECLHRGTPGALAHLELEGLDPEHRRPLLPLRDRYEAVLRRLLEAGAASGELEVEEPKVTALALLGALNWTVKWYRPDGDRSLDEVGEAFSRLFLRGLALRPTSDIAKEAADGR